MSAVVIRPDFGRGTVICGDTDVEGDEATLLTNLANNQVIEHPVQPGAAADVMRLCQLAELPFDRMASAIVQDAALAARVLQVANSAFYGENRPVANISHALMRVGERGLQSVLLGAASGRVFHVRGQPELTRRLQVRAVGVAIAVEGVLRRVGNDRGDAFAAGLLHDIGWSVGVGIVHRYRAQLPVHWVTDTMAMLRAVERTHCELGGIVADRWRFPPALGAAIRWHHEPELAEVGAPVAYGVAAGIALLNRLGIHPEGPALPEDHPIFVRLRLNADQQLEVRREVWVELERLGLVRDRSRVEQDVKQDRRAKKAR